MHSCWIKVNLTDPNLLNDSVHYVYHDKPNQSLCDCVHTWCAESHSCSHQHPLMPVLWTFIHHYRVNTVPLNANSPANKTKHHHFLGCHACVLWNGQAGLTWSCWSCSCCESWPCVGCWDHKLKPAVWQNGTFSLRHTENTHHSLNVGDYRASMPAPCTSEHCCLRHKSAEGARWRAACLPPSCCSRNH